jgi:hypothetical protein
VTKDDARYLDDLLFEAGDRISGVAAALKRHGWDNYDAKKLVRRVDELRSELSEAFDKEQAEEGGKP